VLPAYHHRVRLLLAPRTCRLLAAARPRSSCARSAMRRRLHSFFFDVDVLGEHRDALRSGVLGRRGGAPFPRLEQVQMEDRRAVRQLSWHAPTPCDAAALLHAVDLRTQSCVRARGFGHQARRGGTQAKILVIQDRFSLSLSIHIHTSLPPPLVHLLSLLYRVCWTTSIHIHTSTGPPSLSFI
jgi:hypothetical protein